METYALIFLIVVGVLYAVSIRIVTVQRYKEIEEWYGFGGVYPEVEIENKYYILSIIACLIVVGWCLLLKDPYQPIKDLTPSSATSGWLWATTAAFLVCIPIGLTVGFLGLLIEDVRPESEGMVYIVVISGLISVVFQAMLLFKVYSPWLIWFPMCSWVPSVFFIKKWLPGEDDVKSSSSTSSSSSTTNSASSWSYPDRSSSQTHRSSSASQSSSSSSRSEDYERAHMRDEYYSQYQYYQDQAERLLSEAESYDRSADDNEYWAREANNSFKAAEARNDRNRASRLRSESREARRQADRYYDLYRQYSR